MSQISLIKDAQDFVDQLKLAAAIRPSRHDD